MIHAMYLKLSVKTLVKEMNVFGREKENSQIMRIGVTVSDP